MSVLHFAILQDLIDFLPWFIAACSLVVLASIVFKSFPPPTTRKIEELKPKPPPMSKTPVSMGSTISDLELDKTQNELKTLHVERDIVSYALTRLIEAEAQGRITEEEKNRLLLRYKEDMSRLERSIEEREMIVDLHELESMQSNLLGMFQKRFDDISSRIEEVRSELGLEAKATSEIIAEKVEEEMEETPEPQVTVQAPAEDKIRRIREEVKRDLEKLEQMEVEEVYDELDRTDETEDSS
jgi:anti-anti-sigma regulatory factor